jgi:hypothetical protein
MNAHHPTAEEFAARVAVLEQDLAAALEPIADLERALADCTREHQTLGLGWFGQSERPAQTHLYASPVIRRQAADNLYFRCKTVLR